MAVRKLFWEDPYLTQTTARVTGVHGAEVTVDRTVAFAFSGGQHSDRGTIGGHEILDADVRADEIVYTLPADHGLTPDDIVVVAIEPYARYRIMRLDFAWSAGSIAEAFPLVLRDLRRLVAADLEIASGYSDESAQHRYWHIEGFAQVPCGGTHIRRTGELGEISLKRENPGAGKERIEIRLLD